MKLLKLLYLFLFTFASSNLLQAAAFAGGGIEVDGKWICGYGFTWDGESRQELLWIMPDHRLTFERDYKIKVDPKNKKKALIQGKIKIYTKIRGDREMMCETTSLELLEKNGNWYLSRKSLLKAMGKNIQQKKK